MARRYAHALPMRRPGRIDRPECGFFATRLRSGRWAGVAIYRRCPMVMPERDVDPSDWCMPLDRSRPLFALCDGRVVNPLDVWTWCAGNPITAAEYAYLVADGDWHRQFAAQADNAPPPNVNDLPVPTF